MASRKAKSINGHVTTTEYRLKNNKMVYDAKVLVGADNHSHSLPDYSHSPNSIYIKENSDGTFREMRIYDSSGFPIVEIAYHPEAQLTGSRSGCVLHYHTFKPDLGRHPAVKLSPFENGDLYEKYRKYLKEYGL